VKAQELSRQYAVAVFSQALEKWLAALRVVRDRLAENPALAQKLQDTRYSFEGRKKDIDSILPDGSDQYVKNFFYLLLKEGHVGLLAEIMAELEHITQGGPQVQLATVTTALSLTDSEKDQFRQKLRQKYGEGLEFEFIVDSSIIGGAMVQVGDKIIDGSVATRLEAMSNLLGVK